jgi:hypothetical protein
MNKEHWVDDTDRENPKYSEKNLSQCHSIRHKSHVDWRGIETGSLWWQAWAMARLVTFRIDRPT